MLVNTPSAGWFPGSEPPEHPDAQIPGDKPPAWSVHAMKAGDRAPERRR